MAATKRDMGDGEIYAAVSRRAAPEAHARIDAMMHALFDGSEPELIEAERKLFEADAEQYGFDLTRYQCAAPEPWSEYADAATGNRWGGWLAARAMPSNVFSGAVLLHNLGGCSLTWRPQRVKDRLAIWMIYG